VVDAEARAPASFAKPEDVTLTARRLSALDAAVVGGGSAGIVASIDAQMTVRSVDATAIRGARRAQRALV
jgi:hypothetical protein